jgi:hypothetical protein
MTILAEPHVRTLAQELGACLDDSAVETMEEAG